MLGFAAAASELLETAAGSLGGAAAPGAPPGPLLGRDAVSALHLALAPPLALLLRLPLTPTQTLAPTPNPNPNQVSALQLSAASEYLVAGHASGRLVLWAVLSRTPIR